MQYTRNRNYFVYNALNRFFGRNIKYTYTQSAELMRNKSKIRPKVQIRVKIAKLQ